MKLEGFESRFIGYLAASVVELEILRLKLYLFSVLFLTKLRSVGSFHFVGNNFTIRLHNIDSDSLSSDKGNRVRGSLNLNLVQGAVVSNLSSVEFELDHFARDTHLF